MKVLTADEARQMWLVLEPAITQALSRQGPPSPLFQGELFRAIFTGQARVLMGDTRVYCPYERCPISRPPCSECKIEGQGGIGVVHLDGDVCNLYAYNGTLREIKLLKDEFVKLAREAGCRTIRITGDPAWMRVVPELRQRCVVMELQI